MPALERRDTDEIVSAIQHRETQRNVWFIATVLAFVFSTVTLVREGGHADVGIDFIYSPMVNAVLAAVSMIFYRTRVRAGERIGFVLPSMLALISCILVWMLTRH
jgi:amino acid permease